MKPLPRWRIWARWLGSQIYIAFMELTGWETSKRDDKRGGRR